MSTERFAERIGKALDRRGFLGRLGGGAAATVAALFGFSQPANAGTRGPLCCDLCEQVPVGTPCQGAPYCTWAWTCCSGGTEYRCIEGYYQPGCPGSGQCDSEWRCSGILATGNSC